MKVVANQVHFQENKLNFQNFLNLIVGHQTILQEYENELILNLQILLNQFD